MISPVLSVEPSFTMIHSSGAMVWDTIDLRVYSIYSSSLRTGVITTYLYLFNFH